jgi:hypothetical protein
VDSAVWETVDGSGEDYWSRTTTCQQSLGAGRVLDDRLFFLGRSCAIGTRLEQSGLFIFF